jgi:dihydropteroate synthase
LSPREFSNWLSEPNQPNRRRPLVMGVLNCTPDSFSDGGRFATTAAAVAQAEAMAAAGADLIDVGGESTRPGSLPVDAAEQVARVVPVIQRIANLPVTISIDTTRAAVAEAALDAGAALVNDISAGRDDAGMLPLVARRGVPVVLMHMQGTPLTMQDAPSYRDVVAETIAFLRERCAAAQAAGVELAKILLDPGIGFGKTQAHNLELLRRQREFNQLGRPVVIGASRKGFIGRITGEPEPAKRLFGTAVSVALAVANGAAIVRVHDVGPMVQVVRMAHAIVAEPPK